MPRRDSQRRLAAAPYRRGYCRELNQRRYGVTRPPSKPARHRDPQTIDYQAERELAQALAAKRGKHS